jgi:hypothetical protein
MPSLQLRIAVLLGERQRLIEQPLCLIELVAEDVTPGEIEVRPRLERSASKTMLLANGG